MMLHCRWRCPVYTCNQSVSLRSGTFFDKSRLSLKQWLVLFYWWARQYPVTDAAEEAEVEKKTAIQAYQYCRDICSWRLLHHDSPMLLGGPGVTVYRLTNHSFATSPRLAVHEDMISSYLDELCGVRDMDGQPQQLSPASIVTSA